MISRKNTLRDQGWNCITMLVLGISNAPFIPRDLQLKLFPVSILVLILALSVAVRYQATHSKEEIQREQRDERSQMILEQAVWYCRQAEDWILLALFVVFGVFLQQRVIAYTLFWVMIGRNLLSFAIRWWLDRKY